jgi:hypothetical protein
MHVLHCPTHSFEGVSDSELLQFDGNETVHENSLKKWKSCCVNENCPRKDFEIQVISTSGITNLY